MRATMLGFAACASPAPSVEKPAPAPVAVADDAVPDAGIAAELANAPPWIFRYTTKDRAETWTLRFTASAALVDVETANGTMRYVGSASEGATLAIEVATSTAKLKLDCKRAKRPLSAKCNDAKAKPVDVLDCYHPDFKAPMPFGHAPGVEYVVDERCNGYRLR